MEAKDFISIVFSGLAIVVSIITFLRTSHIGERQSLLAANRPLIDWAAKVAALIGDVSETVTVLSHIERQQKLFSLAARVGALLGEGIIVVAYVHPKLDPAELENNAMIKVVERIGQKLNSDIPDQSESKFIELNSYALLIEDFAAKVATEMRKAAG